MKITTTEDKKNKILIVNATANGNTVKKERATTTTIETYLNNNNIKFGECIKSDSVCNRNGKMSGEWRFNLSNKKKIVDKPPSPVVSSNSAKRTKKTSSKPKDE